MNNSIRIEKADDGTFIINTSKKKNKKGDKNEPMMVSDYEDKTLTAVSEKDCMEKVKKAIAYLWTATFEDGFNKEEK